MCLLLFAYRQHPEFPLIVAANRDEFHRRPTEPAAWRQDVLSGLDREAGGTWMGVSRNGRFAAVTNYRDPAEHLPDARSRGLLVQEALQSGLDDAALFAALQEQAHQYNGFNLIFGGPDGLYSLSNRGPDQILREPGFYGLSNHLLETPWPKVERGKASLGRYVESNHPPDLLPLFELLADRHRPTDDTLPDTGVGLSFERLLAPIFICSPDYGTRSSTVLLYRSDGEVTFSERRYGADGVPAGTGTFVFRPPRESRS